MHKTISNSGVAAMALDRVYISNERLYIFSWASNLDLLASQTGPTLEPLLKTIFNFSNFLFKRKTRPLSTAFTDFYRSPRRLFRKVPVLLVFTELFDYRTDEAKIGHRAAFDSVLIEAAFNEVRGRVFFVFAFSLMEYVDDPGSGIRIVSDRGNYSVAFRKCLEPWIFQ